LNDTFIPPSEDILDNRQFFKAVLDPRRDILSPAFDGLSTLHLKVKATIATAVTIIKAVSTPVQNFQEQSSFSPILGIIACMILALVGIVLTFQHFRQGASFRLLRALIIAIHLLNPVATIRLRLATIRPMMNRLAQVAIPLLLLSLTSFMNFLFYTWTMQSTPATKRYAIRTVRRPRRLLVVASILVSAKNSK
jgi:hypothetical protein